MAGAAACGTTVDSIGDDAAAEPRLRPLEGPATYPNPARDVLGLTDAEIQDKLEATFQRLFHGDPDVEAIYFTEGADRAYVKDILHDDVRTEGVALGMLICVQLDKQDEFDKLWRYARGELEYTTEPQRGYFASQCGAASADTCSDPYGHQQFVMALMFAHGRWGSEGDVDYEADTLGVLDVMRAKEAENGGVVDGVTDMFHPDAQLPRDVPEESAGDVTRPSLVMPAYYELWAQATGDAYWSEAASKARAYLQSTAHPTTGLYPLRADFEGDPIEGSELFEPEGYRAELNIALDYVWFDRAWSVLSSDRLLDFFVGQGIDTYGTSYTLPGEPVGTGRETALVSANGALAASASVEARAEFLEQAWNLEPTVGLTRYYPGLMQLLSLLVMSGNMRVY